MGRGIGLLAVLIVIVRLMLLRMRIVGWVRGVPLVGVAVRGG